MGTLDFSFSGPKALARRGRSVLTAELPAPRTTARVRVRIYYRSEGGDVLACDSDPLTPQAAQDLCFAMRREDSAALHAALVDVEGREHGAVPKSCDGARLVTLPSQGQAPTMREVEEEPAELAAVPPPVAPPTPQLESLPPPPSRPARPQPPATPLPPPPVRLVPPVAALPSAPQLIDCEACGDRRTVEGPAALDTAQRIPCPTCMPREDAPVVRASDFDDEPTLVDPVVPFPAMENDHGERPKLGLVDTSEPRSVAPVIAPRPPSDSPDLSTPITNEERRGALGRIEDRLAELHTAGAISTDEKKRRLRASKDAFNHGCLWKCPLDGCVYGRNPVCPKCGKYPSDTIAPSGLVTPGDPVWETHSGHVSQPARWRRLAMRFTADILRVDGDSKMAWQKRAEAALPDLWAIQARRMAEWERFFDEMAERGAAELAAEETTRAAKRQAKAGKAKTAAGRAAAAWGVRGKVTR